MKFGKKMILGVLLVLAVLITCLYVRHEQKVEEALRQEAIRQAEYEKAVRLIEQKYGKFEMPLERFKRNLCFARQAYIARETRKRTQDFILQYADKFTSEKDASEYSVSIMNYSEEHDKDPLLIAAMVKWESTFKKDEIGTHHDSGAMQILPGTAKKIAKSMNMKDYDLFDIDTNIKMGTKYFQDQVIASRSLSTFRGTKYKPEYIGLILYNRGIGNALNEFKRGKPITYYADQVTGVYNDIKAEYNEYVKCHPILGTDF